MDLPSSLFSDVNGPVADAYGLLTERDGMEPTVTSRRLTLMLDGDLLMLDGDLRYTISARRGLDLPTTVEDTDSANKSL